MSIFERLYRIAKSNAAHYADTIKEKISPNAKQEEPFSDYTKQTDADYKKTYDYTKSQSSTNQKTKPTQNSYNLPQQVLDDLAVFSLSPPSSMQEVKKARNREMKKFHSDKFINDKEKFETSKKIMQIYNAAYDRLEQHYKNNTT